MRKTALSFAILMMLFHLEVCASTIVFQDDFEGGAQPSVWSATVTDTTPFGAREFLGQFSNDVVSLSLAGLPAHTSIQIDLQLFVIRTWDGNDVVSFGPDEWDLSVNGGPNLLHTTFSNVGPPGERQAFPGQFPGGDFPAQTGTAEVNTLGYNNGDSVYNLSFTFPHIANSVQFDFSAIGLQDIGDESWGIDNVSIAAVPEPSTFAVGSLLALMIAGVCRPRRTT